MNYQTKLYLGWKSILSRIALALVLLFALTMVALGSPDTPDKHEDGGKNPGHQRRIRERVQRAPIEQKGQKTELQHAIVPPAKEMRSSEGESLEAPGDTSSNPNNRLYLPFVSQDDAMQQGLVEAAAAGLPVDLKLLVISADGKETDYPAITAFLSQIGIPFDTLIASQTPLTASKLSDGAGHGYYQGIILITGNLSFLNPATNQWESAFTQAQWNILWQYEAQYKVRQVTSYTYPGGWPDAYGLSLVTYQDTTTTPLNATLTTAGKNIYPYLKPTSPITFKNAWVYLATITDTLVTTPLITSGNYAIASIHAYPDGRQNLAITAANNPYLLHSLLLSYGAINWVTKGLFLGERHVYMAPQNDDILIDDNMWDTTALTDTTDIIYRMAGSDLTALVNWQNSMRTTYPLASTVKVEWAFVGEGASGIYTPDTLTSAVKQTQTQNKFSWVNHTFTHANLDAITYTLALQELNQNHTYAVNQLHLPHYFKDTMVNPDISGLYNSEFFRAAKDFGIKYLISDTSRPEWNNPSPNTGFYSTFQSGILIIPRHPANLFYNLRTPAEWVSEYNCYYGPTGICANGAWRYWDHNLSYAEILDKESTNWLQYMLKWDIDPLMFHQPNTGAYDGVHSLLGDLINATLAKYSQMYTLPIVGITQHDIGIRMEQRMAYNTSGVKATLTPCQSITLSTVQKARIPLTGVTYGTTANRETYGGQTISYVQLAANQSVVIPVPACP